MTFKPKQQANETLSATIWRACVACLRRAKAPLVPILLLAFGLRVWGLGDRNLWWDEGFSAWIAQQPVAQLAARTAQDVHPPLYYLLLHGWQTAIGPNDFALRYLSVIAGLLSVAFIYQLARALGDRRAGWLAALFLAISPFAITWSQEMRMYTGAALWTTAGLWAAWQLWQSGRWRYWAVYVLAGAAALWTLYLAASLLLIANIGFLAAWWSRRRDRRLIIQWISAQAAVVALFLPWLAFMLPRAYFGWNAAESFSPLFFLQLYATTLAAGVSENLERYLLPTLLVMAILLAVTVPLWRNSRAGNRRAGLVMLLAGLILPAALVYLGALPFDLFYSVRLAPRYFFPLAVCFYTLLGLGLAAQAERRRWLAAALTGLVAATAILGLASVQGGHLRRDLYDSLVVALQAERQPGDALLLHSDKDWPVFAAQYPGPWTGVPNAWRMDAASTAGLLGPIWDAADGVWLVTTPEAAQTDPQALVRGWLEARALATRAWDYGDNTLAFYARTPQRRDLLDRAGPAFVLPSRAVSIPPADDPLDAAWLPLHRYALGDTVHLSLFWQAAPDDSLQILLRGPVERSFPVAPARLSASGGRQQVDLHLLPDLPPGRYQVAVQPAAGQPFDIGSLALIRPRSSPDASAEEIAHPLDLRLGPAIRLAGYDLAQDSLAAGDALVMTLYWQTDQPLAARYKVFTHLLGQVFNAGTGNFIWGQVDSEPVGGEAPTTAWTPGEIIADRYTIAVAADAPPGQYTLEIGLYGLVNGQRLPVSTAGGQPLGDTVNLGVITVQPAGPD